MTNGREETAKGGVVLTTKSKSKIGRMARRKGADFERFIVRLLNSRLPAGFSARRRLQSRGGWREPDVGVFADSDPRPHWHIECKCMARPSEKKAIAQARAQADPLANVAVILKNTTKHETTCYILRNERLTAEKCTLQKLTDEIAREIYRWCIGK